MSARGWWEDAVGYEIYLPSFADASGDGLGDLAGATERLEHLAWLGVDIVWVTPFYPSPLRDHGYDVTDYTDVDPRFGTLDDLDALVRRAHDLGLRVVIDLVPNHTSSDHPWFGAALSGRDSPYRDFYVWRDPAPDGGPPNNWVSHFGGPAWTYDEASGQYWLHLFLPEQPDLNWRNPDVADAFDDILRFWLDRGVDGFRIDVAHALHKHPDFPDLPPASGPSMEEPIADESPMVEHDRFDHVFDVDQPEVLEVYRRWRKIADAYDAVLIGEVYLLEIEPLARYLVDRDGLHLAFWFAVLHARWDPDELRTLLVDGAAAAPGSIAWVQGSHDRARAPSRFGSGDTGRARSLALATLFAGLPGTPFVYQGEELALTDGELTLEDAQDPVARYTGDVRAGRDGCRTPMPWEPESPCFGFSRSASPWLPTGGRTDADTVAVQRDDPGSWLNRYRALLAVRRARQDLRRGAFAWLIDTGPIIAYRRGETIVAANCGPRDATLELPAGEWTVAFASRRVREDERPAEVLALAPAEAVILAS